MKDRLWGTVDGRELGDPAMVQAPDVAGSLGQCVGSGGGRSEQMQVR